MEMQMMKPLRKLTAASLLGLITMTNTASAHGAWVAERHGQFYVVYGHGAGDDAYDPAKVTLLQACDLALACKDIARLAGKDFVAFEKTEAPLIRLEFDNGYWSKDTAGEWQPLPKDQVPGATEGGHYVKTSTHVFSALTQIPPAFGKGLEIRPLADPMGLHKGDPLAIEVLIDGQPAAGAEITVDYIGGDHHEAPITAGADGKAIVLLPSGGLNVILASYTTAPADPTKADETGHAAALSFALPHGPEE
jgi:nickel transport protein